MSDARIKEMTDQLKRLGVNTGTFNLDEAINEETKPLRNRVADLQSALAARDEVIRELVSALPYICDTCDGGCAVCRRNQGLRSKALSLISNYILATIPERPGDEITADWLRECWGFDSPISGAWNHTELTGTFCFEDDGISWWHVGNRTAHITTRHQFAQLMAALGIEPKKGEVV